MDIERQILNASSEIYCVLSSYGNVLYVNERTIEGKTLQLSDFKSFFSSITKEERSQWEQSLDPISLDLPPISILSIPTLSIKWKKKLPVNEGICFVGELLSFSEEIMSRIPQWLANCPEPVFVFHSVLGLIWKNKALDKLLDPQTTEGYTYFIEQLQQRILHHTEASYTTKFRHHQAGFLTFKNKQRNTFHYGLHYMLDQDENAHSMMIGTLRNRSDIEIIEDDKDQIWKSLLAFKERFEYTEDGLFFLQASDLEVIYVNKGGARILKMDVERILNTNWSRYLLDNQDKSSLLEQIFQLPMGSRYINSEFSMLNLLGEEVHVSAVFQYVESPTNSPFYMVHVRDNSSMVKAERQAKESVLKFRAIFEQASIGIAQSNMQMDETIFNKAFCKLLDIPTDTCSLNYFFQLTHPDYTEIEQANWLEILSLNIDNVQYEKSICMPDGSIRWLQNRVNLVRNDENDVVFLVLFTVDITKRKQNAESLEAALSELKKRNFELDQFVYKSSHDLRAPLTSLMGLIHIIRMEEDRTSTLSYLEMMEKSIQRLDTFIVSILNYSKINHQSETIECIDWKEHLLTLWEDLQFDLKGNQMAFLVQVNQNIDFYTNILRLTTVFRNILSNAIKYRKKGNPDSQLKVIINVDSENATIQFIDNGIGIAEEHLDHLFKMFYRASTQSEGSGLGMYILKETLEKMNGKIVINSQISVGTQIELVIPNLINDVRRS